MSTANSGVVDSVSDINTVTGQLCDWIYSIKLSDVPQAIRTRATYLILDGIGCALSGSHLPWSETAVRAVTNFESSGPCTVIGWDRKLSPMGAAMLNSAFVQGFEIDDFHSAAPLHSNSLLLPSLLAACQQISNDAGGPSISGADLLLAFIVGYEVGPRVGLALYGSDILSRGWHSGAVFGPAAVAAAVGKILRLTPAQLEDAQGIACTQACGLMSAQFGSMVKRMQHGFAARNGLFACLVAREGYTGIKNVFDQTYGGFLSCFGDQTRNPPYLKDEICRGLNETWQIEGIKVKLYAAVAATHGAINCIANLQHQHPEEMAKLDAIAQIDIDLSSAAFEHGGWKVDENMVFTSLSAQMNVAYTAAAQLLDGQVSMAQFSAENLNRSVLRPLIKKVHPIHNTTFDANPADNLRTRVTMRFMDGASYTTEVHAARGIDPPASNEEVLDKWHSLVVDLIEPHRASAIEEKVLQVEDLDDISSLFKLLDNPVKSALA